MYFVIHQYSVQVYKKSYWKKNWVIQTTKHSKECRLNKNMLEGLVLGISMQRVQLLSILVLIIFFYHSSYNVIIIELEFKYVLNFYEIILQESNFP